MIEPGAVLEIPEMGARVEVRQTRADRYRPELYIIAADGARQADVLAAAQAKIAALQREYPGVGGKLLVEC